MGRVLLTGASGFIGRQCIAPLRARGFEVHAVARVPVDAGEPGVYWHALDLLADGQAAALMDRVRPTHLLHLAWYAVPGKYWTAAENFAWVRASLALLQAFAEGREAGCGGRVVMAGTCAEYDWSAGRCVEAMTPLRPTTVYGTSKHALQIMLAAFARQFGMSSAWGRIFFLYGPYEPPSRLVSSVILALLRGEPAPCSSGEQLRDFLYVSDVADAFVGLLDSPVEGPINIASGQAVTIRDVVHRIGDKIGRSDLLRLGVRPTVVSEPPLLVADVERLSTELGWRPRYDLDSGLDAAIAWWRGQLA